MQKYMTFDTFFSDELPISTDILIFCFGLFYFVVVVHCMKTCYNSKNDYFYLKFQNPRAQLISITFFLFLKGSCYHESTVFTKRYKGTLRVGYGSCVA